MLGSIPKKLWPAATKAWHEGRLSWRVTDAQGRPCNGGSAEPLRIGAWSERRTVQICKSGWHTTTAPHKWRGQRVWLVELDGIGAIQGDKIVSGRIRVLAEVDTEMACHVSLLVRCSANLHRANLTGANLTGANLTGAYLHRADLTGACTNR